MIKYVEVYNLAMSPFLISLAYSHAVFNTSSLSMSISSLIWMYNMDMKMHITFHYPSTWTWKSILTLIQTEPLEEEAINSG